VQSRPFSTGHSGDTSVPLYPTHTSLNPVQKGAVALFAALGALYRPARADLVATVGETWGLGPVLAMRDRMRDNPTGRLILQERPRITSASVDHCWDLSPGTFGRSYADFMGTRGFQADDRPPVRFIDDEELAYVVARAREVHDFWHVLFDCHTNVFGELALKALEFVQTGLPMTGLAVLGGQSKLSAEDRQVLWNSYLPWAAKTGLRCADLMSIYYEHHFEEDLQELRTRWRITPAPPPPQHLAPKLK